MAASGGLGAPTLSWSPAAHTPTVAQAPFISNILERRQLSERSVPAPTQTRKFFCRTGYFLQIWPDGTVNTTTEFNSDFSILEFLTTLSIISNVTATNSVQLLRNRPMGTKQLRIRGQQAGMWLCMNKHGNLYGSKTWTPECEFQKDEVQHRRHRTSWGVYYSTRYPINSRKKWYIAFDRDTGQPISKMTKIKKTSKCATKSINTHEPGLLIPGYFGKEPNRNIFSSSAPSGKQSRPYRRPGGDRSTDASRPRPRQKSTESVLSSLESVLLDSSYFTISFDSLNLSGESPDTNERRHSNSRRGGRRRKNRRKYSRLRPADDDSPPDT